MLLGALVNAATFASLTFLAPVVTDSAGLGELWISVTLVLFGAGSFVGVTVAGRLSDRSPGPVIAVTGPLLLIGWPALAVLANEPPALFTLVFVQGALAPQCRRPWTSPEDCAASQSSAWCNATARSPSTS
jgi:DHA1 family chloramphenicol resistance protein-like MFS transporter